MTLDELTIGKTARIENIEGEGDLRQHFLDMGMIPGVEVTLVKFAPMGDPMEVQIHGYELTLRIADAKKIRIKPVLDKLELHTENRKNKPDEDNNYRNLQKSGHYQVKSEMKSLKSGNILSFALVGNQNCGKTTLFNQLTGSNQHVGNFPGVTVDRKDGSIKGHQDTMVTDLPGIYSLSPYSSEEIVSREFILKQKPAAIINIIDATSIERSLYLTMQLMELDIPVVLALNMMDEIRGNGGYIDIKMMEGILGIPVVPISAAKNEGTQELVNCAINIAKRQQKPGRVDFCEEDDHNGAVHRCLHGIMHLIADHAKRADIPVRFAATKLIEGDARVLKALKLTQNEIEMTKRIVYQMEEERGLDRAAAIADMRFCFIMKLVNACVKKSVQSRERIRSKKMDKILTGQYTAIPMFIVIMALIFHLTFNVIGAWLQELLDTVIGALTVFVSEAMTAGNVNEAIHSLVIDGIFNGIGSVLSFIPTIVTLFFFLSLLEDTGYMARVAFVMDKLLRKIGLSGRSIVPMLIGFGCTVPGVMAARTLPSERDRKMTILLTPFMSCSAKLPIYGFFTEAFFPDNGGVVMVLLYFGGIMVGILTALISRNSLFKGDAVPFVMELPNYRMPGAKNVGFLLWDKAKDFLQRAFTIIFIATIAIWFLQSFNYSLNMVENSQDSILAGIAGGIAPVFQPLGFGDWRISTALISGFMAKESVVSTLSVLFGNNEELLKAITPLTAASLLVFCLLYTPCMAAVASIRRELGGQWAAFVVVMQCVIAWICAFLVLMLGQLFI